MCFKRSRMETNFTYRESWNKNSPEASKQQTVAFAGFDQEIAPGWSSFSLAKLGKQLSRGYCRARVYVLYIALYAEEDAAKGRERGKATTQRRRGKGISRCAARSNDIRFIGSRFVEQKIRLSSFHARFLSSDFYISRRAFTIFNKTRARVKRTPLRCAWKRVKGS